MYFDNAATTAHKPEEVARAVYEALAERNTEIRHGERMTMLYELIRSYCPLKRV